jgi:DNA-binding protein HU-beta
MLAFVRIFLSDIGCSQQHKLPQEERVNKSELIDAIAEHSGLTKADSERALAAFIETVVETVRSGDKVNIIGFGAFSVTDRKARTGRNPATGGTLQIAASKAPKFSAGAGFKGAVNEKKGKAPAKPAAKKGK